MLGGGPSTYTIFFPPTKDNARDESEEAAKHGDREKGGAEEVNPEGEGTSGGVKENVQDEFEEAQKDD